MLGVLRAEGKLQTCICCKKWMFLAHLKLVHELRKDAKEALCVGGFAIFSKVRSSFAEFFHSSLLQGLQRLDRWVTVFQEVLHTVESRHTNWFYWISFTSYQPAYPMWSRPLPGIFLKDTLITTANRSSAVAGIFWQAVRMSWMVVWRSFRSDVIVLWFTINRKQENGKVLLKWVTNMNECDNNKLINRCSVHSQMIRSY